MVWFVVAMCVCVCVLCVYLYVCEVVGVHTLCVCFCGCAYIVCIWGWTYIVFAGAHDVCMNTLCICGCGCACRIRFGSPFSWKFVVWGHCLVTLSLTINETLKWLSLLPILMLESFWWWQCSDTYIISLFPYLILTSGLGRVLFQIRP